MIQKIKIFSDHITNGYYSVYNHIEFGIYLKDIPNWEKINTLQSVWNYVYTYNLCDDDYIHFKICGRSSCTKNDQKKFNQIKGEHIAKTKAQTRIHKVLMKFYDGLIKVIMKDTINDIMANYYRHGTNYKQCENHLRYSIYSVEDRQYIDYGIK